MASSSTTQNPGDSEDALLWEAQIGEGFFQYYTYHLTGNLPDLQLAVCLARKLVSGLAPRSIPTLELANLLFMSKLHLARTLLRRFQHTRQAEDVAEAIGLYILGFHAVQDSNPFRQEYFDSLSVCFFERDGSLDEFQLLGLRSPSANSALRPPLQVLARTLSEEEAVYDCFRHHNTLLLSRYLSQQNMEDLELNILMARQALQFLSGYNPAKTGWIRMQLGNLLVSRFERKNELDNIHEAIDCLKASLELISWSPPDNVDANFDLMSWSPPEPGLLGTCQLFTSRALLRRIWALGRQEDLDDAVNFARQALAVADLVKINPDAPRNIALATCLENLAEALEWQYRITGNVNDLHAAIECSSRAVDLPDTGVLPDMLNNLVAHLRFRYRRSHRGEDLSDMVEAMQRTVGLLPPNDGGLIVVLTNLTYCEYELWEAYKEPEWLHKAWEHIQQAWSIREQDPDLRYEVNTAVTTTYAMILYKISRYSDENEAEAMLNKAIDMYRTGTSAPHHPLSINSFAGLGRLLFQRWKKTNDLADIDEAISSARRTLEIAEASAEPDESVRARKNLGEFLYNRSQSTGDKDNLEEALTVLLEGFRLPASMPHARIEAGQSAIDVLVEMRKWDSAHKLSQEVIDLYMISIGRSQAWREKQSDLWDFSYRIAKYAAIALEVGCDLLHVVDMLETCRGVILGHLVDEQTDLNDLMKATPEKAKRFMALRDEVNSVIDASTSTARAQQIARRIEAEGELSECLGEIRKLQGFHRFLLGPTETELKTAAARGPILIVNVTELRSDALIMTKDVLLSMPLPGLEYEKTAKFLAQKLTDLSQGIAEIGPKNRKFRTLQAWLWNNCVKLIFKKLQDLGYGPTKFHVWWMGVGIANFLPFHAAGKYVGDFRETALSQAISSYTPTLKLLIHARRKVGDNQLEQDFKLVTLEQQEDPKTTPRLSVVIMPSTPNTEKGMSDLKGVEQEASAIESIVGDAFPTQILVQPSARDALACMADSEIIHFACHGKAANPDMSQSHLLLQDIPPGSSTPVVDKLHFRDVVAANLSHGKLAFLSACSTAESPVRNLWDEVIHLVSGFQVAGYLHAIGNLWPSDDEKSVRLVGGFYKHLVEAGEFRNGENVARALNEALTEVAQEFANEPLCWAQFVHFGI